MGLSAVGRRMCLGSRGVPSARRFPNTSSALSGPRASEQKMRSVSPRLHSQGLSGSLVCVCCELQAPGRMGGGDREGRAPLPSDLETLGAPPTKLTAVAGKLPSCPASVEGPVRRALWLLFLPSHSAGAPPPAQPRLGCVGLRAPRVSGSVSPVSGSSQRGC